MSPKAVVLVFDISGSMEKYDMLSRGREAAIQLVREGLKPGDTFVVSAFDTETKKPTERRIGSGGGEAAAQDVPGELSHKPGTNIRWPHHEALRWVEQHRPRKTFLILVSDSYNDPPAAADTALGKYRAYYLPSSLTSYPDTPENRDYERLLKRRNALGVTTWGIGVGIDRQTGRPIERYLAPTPADGGSTASSAAPAAPAPEPKRGRSPLFWMLPGALVPIVLAVLWSLRAQPVTVSLAEAGGAGGASWGPGPGRSFRNYRLRPGAAISLGGAGAAEYDLGYPIPGTAHPVATLRRVGKGFRLEPAAGTDGGAAVLLNQEVLKQTAPIVPGDEIKIRLPATGTVAPREVRLEFGRGRDEG